MLDLFDFTSEVPAARSVWQSHNRVDAGYWRELYLLSEIYWSIRPLGSSKGMSIVPGGVGVSQFR